MTLGKSYEPGEFETKTYQFWASNDCFEASDKSAPGQKSFCIVIPPPNVTGALHMGHALTNTIQDILTRWHRMCGDNTLWLPGTDHAGIATQAQVEKQIAKEGKGPTGRPLTRHDLGRDAFVKRVWQWKEQHGSQITNQLKRLGSSLDWRRERFTMDEGLSSAVREVFVRLYDEKLIYRGERIINWCVRCQTALSDLEVVPTDRKGFIWKIKYPIVEKDGTPVTDSSGNALYVVIATTRPETMLGDTAVAVHPEDERYQAIHGKFAKLPLVNRIIPVISDEYVDREFGTGALKVTPAHDFNDYDLGMKHKLEIIQVMGKTGKITSDGGTYNELKFSEARDKIIEDLKASGAYDSVEEHAHKVGLCQRCEHVAEPMVSKQWFVKIGPLAKPAIEAVETGKIEFLPKSWEKTYFEWMYNIRDWCISRQLWWGHQIPAWYCQKCEQVMVARSAPGTCQACGSTSLKQDDDVLDTWFSSALWPFSTLGWPEKTEALSTFYPTSILETGFDIIFFWVARMIMMGIHFMGEVPFEKVYLHAMVRDEKGEKMSKSKGNVIDPLDVIALHGADPLRFTLASMAGQGRDIKLSVDRVGDYRGFCNKIWNATKFLHLQFDTSLGGAPIDEPQHGPIQWLHEHYAELLPHNAWIVSKLQSVCETVDRGFSAFEINTSTQALYDFAWHEFCDWYIEFAKISIKKGGEDRRQTLITLHYVLEALFRLMHPIMPFVTEELWQSLPWKKPANTKARELAGKPMLMTLMFKTFPKPDKRLLNHDSEQIILKTRSIVEAIRNFRGENNISPKTEFAVLFRTKVPLAESFVHSVEESVCALAKVKSVRLASPGSLDSPNIRMAIIPLSSPPIELIISLEGLVDTAEEIKRVEKEMLKTRADLEHVESKLTRESFISKAPAELVAKERAKALEFRAKLAELEQSLKRFRS